jgi:serine/threonine-protein kinase RsbW
MQTPSTIRLPAKLKNLAQLIGFVSDCAHSQDIEKKRIIEIEIAAEEAFVNIINYAYRDQGGDVEVSCKSDSRNKFVIEIVDSGVPFDPLSLNEPDTSSDISDLPSWLPKHSQTEESLNH